MIKMSRACGKTPNEIALNICSRTDDYLLLAVRPSAWPSIREPTKPVRAVVVAGLPDSHDDRRTAFCYRIAGIDRVIQRM